MSADETCTGEPPTFFGMLDSARRSVVLIGEGP